MNITNYLADALLKHTLAQAAYTMPTVNALSLHTASPTTSGSHSNEVSTSGTGYARYNLLVPSAVMSAPLASPVRSTNSSVITIGPSLSDWGTIGWSGLEDATSSGNMLIYGEGSASRTITTGESFQLVTGQYAITFK